MICLTGKYDWRDNNVTPECTIADKINETMSKN